MSDGQEEIVELVVLKKSIRYKGKTYRVGSTMRAIESDAELFLKFLLVRRKGLKPEKKPSRNPRPRKGTYKRRDVIPSHTADAEAVVNE